MRESVGAPEDRSPAEGVPPDEVGALLARSQEMTNELVRSLSRWSLLSCGLCFGLSMVLFNMYGSTGWWPVIPIISAGAFVLGPFYALRRYWKQSMALIEEIIARAPPGDRRVAATVVGALNHKRFRPHARRLLKEVLESCPPESWDQLGVYNKMHGGDFYADLLLGELSLAMKRKFNGVDDLETGRAIVRTLGDIASPDAMEALTALARARPRSAALRELKAVAAEALPKAYARIEARKQTEHLLHPASAPDQATLLRPARSSAEGDREVMLRVPAEVAAEDAEAAQNLIGNA